jgi:hypothetical protein
MHTKADRSADEYDDVNAPRFFSYLEMNFEHLEHVARRFARDVVNIQDEFEWEFTVNTNLQGSVEMEWDNTMIKMLPHDVFLMDKTNHVLINMKEQTTYTFSALASLPFKVFYGKDAYSKITPEAAHLSQAYPNPSSADVTIAFTVPGQTTSIPVTLEVYNSLGVKVATLISQVLKPGFYSAVWNSQQAEAGNGVYIYRLAIGGSVNQILKGKVIIAR